MDIDFKLDKVIEIFDLVKKLSWGAIPLWFSLTLPVIYIAYKKLLPEQNSSPAPLSFMERVRNWISMPQMDTIVIYTSLTFFVIGTITLYIDQNQREITRNNGLRMKQYLVSENIYSFSKDSLTTRLQNLSVHKINEVLKQHPTDFIGTENNYFVLVDSIPLNKIIITSEKLLDSYLSGLKADSAISIERLFVSPYFFTRRIVYKLITDSSFKYRYNILDNGEQVIMRK